MPQPHPVLLLALLLAGPLLAGPAQAGLLRPVLEVMRPQLEKRITEACVDGLAGEVPELATQLQGPCRQLASRTSSCLVRETDASGKGLAVLSELMQRDLGPESERIVKRCIAQLVGLPANSLEGLSLQQLAQRFGVTGF
ncbi:MAG: hypothetical protein AB1Z22_12720 [Synechococcaceae cyanobacterium]